MYELEEFMKHYGPTGEVTHGIHSSDMIVEFSAHYPQMDVSANHKDDTRRDETRRDEQWSWNGNELA